MSLQIEKNISTFIKNQFPRFYDEEGPAFIEFVKTYYEWMEKDNNPIGLARTLPSNRDIDETLERFLIHFKREYLWGVPENIKTDTRFLIKYVLDLYRSKGSDRGFKLLFRLLYDEDIDIYLPSTDIFASSDGNWYEPKYLECKYHPELDTLVGQLIKGSSSGTTALVEQYVKQPVKNRIRHILYVSHIEGRFSKGEKISKIEDYDTAAIQDSPKINGSLSNITIFQGGRDFVVGDGLRVITGNGYEGEARVEAVANGTGTLLFTLVKGGTLFSRDAISIITRTGLVKVGRGASFNVGDLTQEKDLTYNTDLVMDYDSLTINTGGISNCSVHAGGTGYVNGQFVTFTAQSYIDTFTISNNGLGYSNGDVVVVSNATSNATGVVETTNTGAITCIDIHYPGRNFNTPFVTITSSNGTGASVTANKVTTGSGANGYVVTNITGILSEVRVSVGGNGTGYVVPPVITVPTGTGANVTANVHTDWEFDGTLASNTYTETGDVLEFYTKGFGSIAALDNIATGNNYQEQPIVYARDVIYSKKNSGNVFYSNTSANVTGIGTSFTSRFVSGDMIYLLGNPGSNTIYDHRYITSITNNTFLTLDDFPNHTSNGNITGVVINTSGSLYSNNDTVVVTGGGTGAIISIITDVGGALVDTKIHNPGSGYYTVPTLSITSNTGSGGALLAEVQFAEHYNSPHLIRANFAVASTPSLYAEDGSVSGENETITADPIFGSGIISKVQIKNSGFGYTDGESVHLAPFGAISDVIIVHGGTGYANTNRLVFSGGSPTTIAEMGIETDANGSIISIITTYTGSGYKTIPTVSVITGTGTGAQLRAEIGGINTLYQISGFVGRTGLGRTRGHWTSSKGFTSSDKYLQDSFYYQEYSYEIRSAIALDKYAEMLKRVFHVSGTELFGSIWLREIGNLAYDVAYESIE